MGVVRNDVGSAPAFDQTDVQRAGANLRVGGQGHGAEWRERGQKFVDGGFAQFGISGMRHASRRSHFDAQRSFGGQGDAVFRGLAVYQKSAGGFLVSNRRSTSDP